jgi:hypothetical protein
MTARGNASTAACSDATSTIVLAPHLKNKISPRAARRYSSRGLKPEYRAASFRRTMSGCICFSSSLMRMFPLQPRSVSALLGKQLRHDRQPEVLENPLTGKKSYRRTRHAVAGCVMTGNIADDPPLPIWPICESEVADIFTDMAVSEIATTSGLPDTTNLAALGAMVREAATAYARDVHEPLMGAEIGQLESAVWNGCGLKASFLLSCLSPAARKFLASHVALIHRICDERAAEWLDRQSALLLHHDHQDAALQSLHTLIVRGVQPHYRNRPSGRQSVTVRRIVYAPTTPVGRPRRGLERVFVSYLRLGYEVVTGKPAAQVANTARPSGCAKFVEGCLRLARVTLPKSASDASCPYLEIAVSLINEIARNRKRSLLKAEFAAD